MTMGNDDDDETGDCTNPLPGYLLLGAQKMGRIAFYKRYKCRIAKVERDYGMLK